MSNLREYLRVLRKVYPVPFPVRVVRGTPPGYQGYTVCKYLNGRCVGARVRMSRRLSPAHELDIIIHEWAHLVVADYYGEDSDRAWAVAYAEIYDLFHGPH